ncbi:MAG TPA: CYTH domain-containing protein [Xanthobacteraceae bacterium]|nr:CYTH domain-containing protein [Xanthobacteraceae bacterium]
MRLQACVSSRKTHLSTASGRLPSAPPEVSIYFDTPKRKLHKKGLLLRVRRIGGRYAQTIKASANSRLFERENARVETAMAAARRAFAHLADAKPFWR